MRLSCPNCDAQYEVAEDAVPPGGRDVQCSNCGHAWFQMSPDAEAAMADEAALIDAPTDPQSAPPIAAEAEDGDAGADSGDDDDDDDDGTDPVFDQPPPLKQRPVDDSVLAVLREEAERETAARRRDAEVALAASVAAAAAATGPTPDAAPPEFVPTRFTETPVDPVDDEGLVVGPGAILARSGKGRELLPDIDAIKSTLRTGDDGTADGDDDALAQQPAEMQRTGSFRGGFMLTTGVGILLAILYATAPGMATRFPVTASALGAYVAGIDSARLWLDGLARQAGDSLSARKSEATGASD